MESFTYRGLTISHLNTTHEHWRTSIDAVAVSHDTLEDAQITIDRHLDGRQGHENAPAHSEE